MTLTSLFYTVLNMSVTAAVVIAVVTLVRLPLRRAPKAVACALWFVALFRLLCPVSFESSLSLFSLRDGLGRSVLPYYPAVAGPAPSPTADGSIALYGADAVSATAVPALPAAPIPEDPMQMLAAVLACIWAAVAAGLLIYGMISYILLKRKLVTATRVGDNIYASDRITSPFVAGILRPRIYLPVSLQESERPYIVEHERTHIRRRDHLVKPLWFLAVCLHWFNPLTWLAFNLLERDMEMACDEAVVRKLGDGVRADYSSSLLALSAPRSLFTVSPLAFGESGISARIKNVLSFKKPVIWIVLVTAVATMTLTVILAANPKTPVETAPDAPVPATALPEEQSKAAQFLSYKTDYVGNNSKVGGIISLLDYPVGLAYDHFELQTGQTPYGIVISLSGTDVIRAYVESSESRPVFMRGAAILMSLVKNADYVNYEVVDTDDGKVSVFTFKRDTVNTIYGGDVCACAEDEAAFSEFLASPANGTESDPAGTEIQTTVEQNLEIIMSSPLYSSSTADYIAAHRLEYENILKLGDDALAYMLSCFENGEGNTLKGHIMMALCTDILGERSNLAGQNLLPAEWYRQLDIRVETELPDYAYTGGDPVTKLVYETETAKHQGWGGGFTVVAVHEFGRYEEGDKLKVIVTTFSQGYHLYGEKLASYTGSVVPAAITFTKNADGSYTLSEYTQAKDGSLFSPSIRDMCRMPVSGSTIKGLADNVLEHYGHYDDLFALMKSNVEELLKQNNITGVTIPEF